MKATDGRCSEFKSLKSFKTVFLSKTLLADFEFLYKLCEHPSEMLSLFPW